MLFQVLDGSLWGGGQFLCQQMSFCARSKSTCVELDLMFFAMTEFNGYAQRIFNAVHLDVMLLG